MIVWAEPDQADLVRAATAEAPVELIAAGGPDPDGARTLAEGIDVAPIDDLRAAVAQGNVDLVWLAGDRPLAEATRTALASTADLRVLTARPRPTLASAEVTPLVRRGPAFGRVLDLLPEIAPLRAISIVSAGAATDAPLAGRLHDALDLLVRLAGPPDVVHAIATDAPRTDEDTGLTGAVSITARGAGLTAGLVLDAHGGAWRRDVTLLGAGGAIRFSDDTLEWTGSDGTVLDRHTEDAPWTAGQLIGRALADRERRGRGGAGTANRAQPRAAALPGRVQVRSDFNAIIFSALNNFPNVNVGFRTR